MRVPAWLVHDILRAMPLLKSRSIFALLPEMFTLIFVTFRCVYVAYYGSSGIRQGGEVGGPSDLAIYSAECFGILGIVNICYTEPNGTKNPHEMEV